MITIRFPSGVAVIYNDARFLNQTSSAWELYTQKPTEGGRWIASIPLATQCIVEAVKPCRVENPVTGLTNHAAADMVLENIRELDGRRLKELKMALRDFNAKTYEWNGED